MTMSLEWLKLATAPMRPIRLRVSGVVRPGETLFVMEDDGPALWFHSNAEMQVWLDQMRESGMQG